MPLAAWIPPYHANWSAVSVHASKGSEVASVMNVSACTPISVRMAAPVSMTQKLSWVRWLIVLILTHRVRRLWVCSGRWRAQGPAAVGGLQQPNGASVRCPESRWSAAKCLSHHQQHFGEPWLLQFTAELPHLHLASAPIPGGYLQCHRAGSPGSGAVF